MARLMIDFANALGLEQVHLNGHSFSAAVAAHMAAAWDKRIHTLIMTCPCTYHNDLERRIVRVIHHITAVWMALRRAWMVGNIPLYRFVSRSFFYRTPKDATVLRAIFDDFFCMDQRTALESAINAANPGYNDVLRQITQPTLIIGCRQDRVMPRYGPPLVAKRVPHSRIVWLERCGHLPMIERPAVYHHILQEFLTNDQHQFFSLS
jgi:pimeloyl-ACP methyl ester carboxylesterase